MKYETPELTALTAAIEAVQALPKDSNSHEDSPLDTEVIGAYADWE